METSKNDPRIAVDYQKCAYFPIIFHSSTIIYIIFNKTFIDINRQCKLYKNNNNKCIC